MKDLLRQMFIAWCAHENSYDPETRKFGVGDVEAAIEATNGDVLRANLLVLFGHWSNDIQRIAAHFGLRVVRVTAEGAEIADDDYQTPGKLEIREDIPPAPSVHHWWLSGKWCEPESADENEAAAGDMSDA